MRARSKGRLLRGSMGVLLLASMLSIYTMVSFGEEIRKIDVDVVLNQDGSADIKQVWDINTEKGTEFYIPMTHMRDMEIKNFRVQDETGKEFTYVENWNVNGSLAQKAYKNGIVNTGNGLEMCWGKGSYGNHTYTLTYTLTNLVQAFPDDDGFISRFVNAQMNPSPQQVKLRITRAGAEPEASFVPTETGVWGYGCSGYINVIHGEIIAETDRPFSSQNHMTVMVRLPKGMLSPVSIGTGTFAEMESRAEEGSDYTPENDDWDQQFTQQKRGWFWWSRWGILGMSYLWMFSKFLFSRKKIGCGKITKLRKDFRNKGGATRTQNIDYYRQLPLGGDIPAASYALMIGDKEANDEHLLGSYILELLRKRALVLSKDVEVRSFLGDKETINLAIKSGNMLKKGSPENTLFKIIQKAAGEDRVLQEKELKKWAKKNHMEIANWLENVRDKGEDHFDNRGGTAEVETQGKFRKNYEEQLTDQGFQMVQSIQGFKRYLEDFTLIAERESQEVELWDGYLVFAALFGIAEKVAKEMKEIYPEFVNVSELQTTDSDLLTTLYVVNIMNRTMYSGYSSGRYESQGGNRSSGGGGFSSFGGGGGFSGGGFGGGSR